MAHPDRAGCLHDLVMSNIRPFIGVFWFFKEFHLFCPFIIYSFGVNFSSEVITLVSCFVSCYDSCIDYFRSSLER